MATRNTSAQRKIETPDTLAPEAKAEGNEFTVIKWGETDYGFTFPTSALDTFIKEVKTLNGAAVTAKGLVYTVSNGLDQSLQDSTAGLAAAIKGVDKNGKAVSTAWSQEKKDKKAIELGLKDSDGKAVYTIEQLVEAAVNDAESKKWAAIVEGTITTRTVGPRLVGLPMFIRDVSEEFYKADVIAFNSKQVTKGMPTKAIPAKAEELKAEIAKWYTDERTRDRATIGPEGKLVNVKLTNKAYVDGEAERRFALAQGALATQADEAVADLF